MDARSMASEIAWRTRASCTPGRRGIDLQSEKFYGIARNRADATLRCAAHLRRGKLNDVRLAKLNGIGLLLRADSHGEFDFVNERTSRPAGFIRRQNEFRGCATGRPIRHAKGAGAHERAVVHRPKNKVAPLSKQHRKIGHRTIRQNHDGIGRCAHIECVAEQLLDGERGGFRRKRRAIAEFHALAQQKLPAFRLCVGLPGNRERGLESTVIVESDEAVENEGVEPLRRGCHSQIHCQQARINCRHALGNLYAQSARVMRTEGPVSGRGRNDYPERHKGADPASSRTKWTSGMLHSFQSGDYERQLSRWKPR